MATVLILPAVAIATSAITAAVYIWYLKPSIAVRLLIRIGLMRAGMTVKYVTLKGGEVMCYVERGVPTPSQPSIVFIHGFSSSKDNWISIIQRLPRDIHVLAVDLIGHGESSLPATDRTPTAQYLTETLNELLEKVGVIGRPIHLIGTSMGGLIGCMYTASYPQHVHMLTAVCPAVYVPQVTETVQEMKELKKNYLIPKTVDDMLLLLDRVLYIKSRIPRNRQMLKGFLQLKEGREEFYQELFKALTECMSEEVTGQLLSRASRPVHILWGTEDEILHVSGVEFMRSKLLDCRRVDIIQQCGHAMTWDQPRQVTTSILEFRAAMLSTVEPNKKMD